VRTSRIYPIFGCLYRISTTTAVLTIGSCGILGMNPNVQTWWQPDAEHYYVEGALSQGDAARPTVGYVQGEGDNPDPGSFVRIGQPGAGISSAGIHVPSGLVMVSQNKRFGITFHSNRRFAIIRLFAWDDFRANRVRDLDEPIAGIWEIKKEDQRGWHFNAPAWNQFNFAFHK